VQSSTVPIKSSLIKRVAAFLASDPENSTELAKDKKTVRLSTTENEFASWRESVRRCSHITQLYFVVKKIGKSSRRAQFQGMKRCLADLKALKAIRNTAKSRSQCRDSMELLQHGILIVEKFLDANQENNIKVGE